MDVGYYTPFATIIRMNMYYSFGVYMNKNKP